MFNRTRRTRQSKVRTFGIGAFIQVRGRTPILRSRDSSNHEIATWLRSRAYPGHPEDLLELWEERITSKSYNFGFNRIIKRKDLHEISIGDLHTNYFFRKLKSGCNAVFTVILKDRTVHIFYSLVLAMNFIRSRFDVDRVVKRSYKSRI